MDQAFGLAIMVVVGAFALGATLIEIVKRVGGKFMRKSRR
jgi:Na+/H+-translocating membrane pyrophosphatase